ncbi:Type II restriction modification system C5-cytosine and N4-cytosine or N6-adenine DNAmethyltransferase [Mycoplasmopsis agalactiae 14628]|uniref:DNA (cytosine-5-)-methyltransferase n=1 Tax=Mycoplasmopsis agalactiae 14628 TaxID=1110504 RepID=I5D668_MYCAA|nr:DNA (cytosine-5-)-methyltransferase [Mycoplasmopsis agalactiae]EIN15177.1 Type II restriction modification system C5-cytosine and N4-cytosine or N6-adenine DNAmethyltransferase [Mycoplasmopsis agalactiae 14628]
MIKFRILDLFSGAGGFSYGLDSLNEFETLIATDFNESALNTFKRNIPKAETILGDITKREVKEQIINKANELKINMIIGGPPCQGFSNKGKKKGLDDPRNFLFLEYLDIVEKVSPELFIIENVKTMLTAVKGYFIDQIVKKIELMGYKISYGVLNAKDFGIPQSRPRAIIIAHKEMAVPLPPPNGISVTVRDAISDLAYLNSADGDYESQYINNAQSEYQKLMRKGSLKLFNHIATKHSVDVINKLNLIPPECGKEYLSEELKGNQKFNTTWGRLKWNTTSSTIDTRFDTPSNGTNTHPELNRAITPREAARLQSFPDKFIFTGSKTEICKQIGNAVPPLLAKAIGLEILRQLKPSSIIGSNYQIHNANSYEIINDLISNNLKVDHIITDPPYNISKPNNFSTLASAKRQGIDFGKWDIDFDLVSWIKPYMSLLNKNGSAIIFCSYRYLSFIINELEKSSMVVKDIIKWVKTNPMPRNVDRRYVQDTEFAIWAVKSNSKWIFNKPASKSYLRANFETPVVSGKEKVSHPTQKSLKLMEEIIKIHTNKNELILDPFMGSGTTGIASLKLKRKFIGIELDEKFFDIASKRISDVE